MVIAYLPQQLKHLSCRHILAGGLCSYCAHIPEHINLGWDSRAAALQSWKLSLNGPVMNLNGCGLFLFDSIALTGVQTYANNNHALTTTCFTHCIFNWKETVIFCLCEPVNDNHGIMRVEIWGVGWRIFVAALLMCVLSSKPCLTRQVIQWCLSF